MTKVFELISCEEWPELHTYFELFQWMSSRSLFFSFFLNSDTFQLLCWFK